MQVLRANQPLYSLRIAVGIILAFVVVLLIFPTTQAYAASNGRIFGQLLNGTKNNAPVAAQSVTLQMAQGNTAKDLTTVKTDAHGAFAFNNLATDKTLSYAVYTRYQGAQYYTNLIDLSNKLVQQINLTVYEATTSTAQIAIVQATVLLHQPDAGVLSFSEILFFRNVGTYTYVGSLNTSKGKPNALLFPLPVGARNVSLDKGFDGYHAVQVDHGFATDAALPPGASQFAFSFELPYTSSNYTFDYSVLYPTVQFSLLAPTNVNVNSNTLTSEGLITADQRPYRLFQAKDLLAGTQLHALFQGLPVTQSTPNSLNQSTIWLIVGLLLLLAIISVTWFLYRSAHRPSRPNQRHQNVETRFIASHGAGARGAGTKEAQKLQDLQELLNLDKAYESGKLKKATYQERRAKTKARLRTLMTEDELNRTSKSVVEKTTKSRSKGAS